MIGIDEIAKQIDEENKTMESLENSDTQSKDKPDQYAELKGMLESANSRIDSLFEELTKIISTSKQEGD